jgi:ribose transport system substrate-binding protein
MNPVRLGLLASLVFGSVVYAKELTIAVIPKGTTHEFWKSVHAGAVKAERELTAAGTPVKLFWKSRWSRISRPAM